MCREPYDVQAGLCDALVTRALLAAAFGTVFVRQGLPYPLLYTLVLFLITALVSCFIDLRRRASFKMFIEASTQQK